MANKKKIILTDKHIALIKNIKFEKFILEDKQHYNTFKSMVNDLKLSDDENSIEYNNSILTELHSFEPQSRFAWGCDQWSLFGGTYVLEDIALILGYFNQAIEKSENLATGRRFPKELETEMYDLYDYICYHMDDIFTIVLNFIDKGGVKPGVYEYKNYEWIYNESQK